jgi:hypothetical protein
MMRPYPRNATRLVGQHQLDGKPFIIGEFIAHDSSPQFGSLNDKRPARRKASAFPGIADHNQPATPLNPSAMTRRFHFPERTELLVS